MSETDKSGSTMCMCGAPARADSSRGRWCYPASAEGRGYVPDGAGGRRYDYGDQAALQPHSDRMRAGDEARNNAATIRAFGRTGPLRSAPKRDKYGCVCGGCSPGCIEC